MIDERTGSFTTRALPADAPATADYTVSTRAELDTALASVSAGEKIEITAGFALTTELALSGLTGTVANPIYICGTSRDSVTLTRASGTAISESNCENVVIEDLTVEGSGVDGGTAATSIFASVSGGENITFRKFKATGFDRGIHIPDSTDGMLAYDGILIGNNESLGWGETGTSNLTWNDDGVDLQGNGNLAFNLDISWFGDAFAFNESTPVAQRACFAYRCKVENCGDDLAEFDEGGRNIGVYDLKAVNVGSVFSVDGLYGGPVYAFRNRVTNWRRSLVKNSATNATGFLCWANTIVATDGETTGGGREFGLYPGGAPSIRGWEFRGNLFVWVGTDNIWWIDGAASGFTPWTVTYNGFRRNGTNIVLAAEGVDGDVAAFNGFSGVSDNVELTETLAQLFVSPPTLGADYTTAASGNTDLELAAGSGAIDAAETMDNINA